MQPAITTIELRTNRSANTTPHERDGLVDLLVGKFEAAVDDAELVQSYAAMTQALLVG